MQKNENSQTVRGRLGHPEISVPRRAKETQMRRRLIRPGEKMGESGGEKSAREKGQAAHPIV